MVTDLTSKETEITVNNRWERVCDAANSAARAVEWDWPSVMGQEDIAQEILLRVVESEKTYDYVNSLDGRSMSNVLRRLGTQIVSKEADAYALFTGQVFYSTTKAKTLLKAGALEGSFTNPDEKIDLETAFTQLDKDYRNLIYARYVLDNVPSRGTSESKRLSLAVHDLTVRMNRYRRRRGYDHENRTIA